MANLRNPTVLIIGAGSMGLVTGYHLCLAGAQVTYLVHPKRAEELKSTQFLYRLDTQDIHEYKSYSYFTDPSSILSSTYDYILITIDVFSWVPEIGFLEKSGLPNGQVTSAGLGMEAYSGKTASLPIYSPANPELVKKADVAYVDSMGNGFLLEDHVTSISTSFPMLYNACGVSNCVIWSPEQTALTIFPMFAVFIGLELLGWPKTKDIDTQSEVWQLTTAAAREVQMLNVCGESGTQTAKITSEDTFSQTFAYLEEKLRPLDFQAFNRFHHGGKVVEQDRMHIDRCISQGLN
ncbi:hypothetical protein FANTH_6050 [Fusarium anthophilum]|uniref:Ketopantoate reductase N-terminal domain-containing protein n=1 Tax=Fusarium anthophilum TaxID=48485 RepID=A0A8H5E694_9HYPO|nr:hypothetical protein FANTH_6050 [Fusarium anthophilum]